ncbi:hypothetical protein XELAEV_18008570mg [Xenopus laevis]|uniref:C-type lectin domain-containing protein n=1 Tax=Xenopus laevis TaxID=8355 RepID=A0A974I5Q7_XENLA|nr:hypothetical protein XELAEV_18008570mg [Xenopus laevis]
MAEQVFYAKLNLKDPESSPVTNKPAGRGELSTRAQREEISDTFTSPSFRQGSGSYPWKYKSLIIGLSVMSLILLIISISLGIMMYNTEGLRQDLDLCSTERHSLNLSLSQSQDSEQNLTHRLQLSSLILTCLRQQIRDAEFTDKCPPGWTLINGKCYFFSDERKTRGESVSFCHKNKAQLATVKPSDATLQRLIKNYNSEYWIGLTAVHYTSPAWYWPDGTIETSLASAKVGSCATMGARLIVAACDVRLRWICEKANYRSDLIDRMNECIK